MRYKVSADSLVANSKTLEDIRRVCENDSDSGSIDDEIICFAHSGCSEVGPVEQMSNEDFEQNSFQGFNLDFALELAGKPSQSVESRSQFAPNYLNKEPTSIEQLRTIRKHAVRIPTQLPYKNVFKAYDSPPEESKHGVLLNETSDSIEDSDESSLLTKPQNLNYQTMQNHEVIADCFVHFHESLAHQNKNADVNEIIDPIDSNDFQTAIPIGSKSQKDESLSPHNKCENDVAVESSTETFIQNSWIYRSRQVFTDCKDLTEKLHLLRTVRNSLINSSYTTSEILNGAGKFIFCSESATGLTMPRSEKSIVWRHTELIHALLSDDVQIRVLLTAQHQRYLTGLLILSSTDKSKKKIPAICHCFVSYADINKSIQTWKFFTIEGPGLIQGTEKMNVKLGSLSPDGQKSYAVQEELVVPAAIFTVLEKLEIQERVLTYYSIKSCKLVRNNKRKTLSNHSKSSQQLTQWKNVSVGNISMT